MKRNEIIEKACHYLEEYLQLKEDIHNEKVIIATAWQDTVKIAPEENIGSIPYPTSFLYIDKKIESLQQEVTQKQPLFNQLESSKNNEGLLILDGRNFFQGTELGVFDKGMTMIEWMNYVGYDAIVPGQYDFIFGIDNLDLLTRKDKFDFLGANIEC